MTGIDRAVRGLIPSPRRMVKSRLSCGFCNAK